jgi:hypothetical protein
VGAYSAERTHLLIIIRLTGLIVLFSTAIASGAPDGRLVGTIRGGGFSGVVIEDEQLKQQTFYPEGTVLPDGSKIIAVLQDSILIRTVDGTIIEYLVKTGKPGQPNAAGRGRPETSDNPAYRPSPDPSAHDWRALAEPHKPNLETPGEPTTKTPL